MIKQLLLLAGLAASTTALATTNQSVSIDRTSHSLEAVSGRSASISMIMAEKNDGQNRTESPRKVDGTSVHWKRPAGQFWGTGFFPAIGGGMFYPYTPLMLRPWVEYTLENISTGVSGSPTWSTKVLADLETGEYETVESSGNNVTVSYLQYEECPAPRLSYPNHVPFPTMFYGGEQFEAPYNEITVFANNQTADYYGETMLVSPHFWSLFSRTADNKGDGVGVVGGAPVYEGMKAAPWFGTNNGGNNAMATRFEKPDRPYLLNAVHWYYVSSGEVPKDIPLTAYVFKTVSDSKIYTTTSGVDLECAELGELIAVSHANVPACKEAVLGASVCFNFTEKNPVTGAESETSLEIEDDIIVVVTGYQVDLGNGGYITTLMSDDYFDEGYGNLGFLGNLNVSEDGYIEYTLVALKDYFSGASYDTTLGVLADVSYPWLEKYYDQPDDILLPNEESTNENELGLKYPFFFQSSAMVDDYEISFNGESECDWLQVIDAGDEMEELETGEEFFTGQTVVVFQADPNPEDVDRTCVVEVTIPCASYKITFRQGSNNVGAVDVVTVDGDAQYFDLQGRRVSNPEKGLYIKKSGNTATKVIL